MDISNKYLNINKNFNLNNSYIDSSKLIDGKSSQNFQNILNGAIEDSSKVQFSKHANGRLLNRNISLSDEQLVRVNDGVKNAAEKGIKQSLVLVDNVALVVSVKNKTVITAIDNKSNSIFTNIDGTVIV